MLSGMCVSVGSRHSGSFMYAPYTGGLLFDVDPPQASIAKYLKGGGDGEGSFGGGGGGESSGGSGSTTGLSFRRGVTPSVDPDTAVHAPKTTPALEVSPRRRPPVMAGIGL